MQISPFVAQLLEKKYQQYNRKDFIDNDPICIPHLFAKKQDIEIMGFIASILAWGQRKTIINKCKELIVAFDNAPYDFIINHQSSDLQRFLHFKHRTFNATDTLYFIDFFSRFYKENDSLEKAFLIKNQPESNIQNNLIAFHDKFFENEFAPHRTRKHVATPHRKSSCKRLNMYLRWMVRQDDNGVDFGIWQKLKPSQLVCPCDVHVDRVARKLGLIKRKQTDWQTAQELTQNLQTLDPYDPVKYDFALFGLGVEGEM